MADMEFARQGDVTELRERIVVLETKQDHHAISIQELTAQSQKLADDMQTGFARLGDLIAKNSSKRAMIISAGSGVGGGLAVGLWQIASRLMGH